MAGSQEVIDLQRAAGNAAVTGWLADARASRQARPQHAAQRQVLVQRQDEESTPEDEFLDDLETGVAKAKEYLEYIPNALEWWNKVGGEMPAGLKEAAENLARISTRISEGLDKFSDVVDKAKQAIQIKKWAESVWDVAQATRNLQLGDKASRDAWIAAVDTLGKRSGPFVDAAKTWLKGLAVRGGLAASRAFIVLQGVTAYAQIGWTLLKAGVKNVEAYTGRFGYEGTEMDKVREAEGQGREVPPEPGFPGHWTTAAERKAADRAMRRRAEEDEKERKRRQRLAPFVAKVEEARKRVAAAKEKFDRAGFAPRYRIRREKLLYQVGHEMRYGKKTLERSDPWMKGGSARIQRGVGAIWWDQFLDADTGPVVVTGQEEGLDLDPISGRGKSEKKERINLEEAQREIENFRDVRPTCTFYNDIYTQELQRYTAKENKALKAANDAYSVEAAKPN